MRARRLLSVAALAAVLLLPDDAASQLRPRQRVQRLRVAPIVTQTLSDSGGRTVYRATPTGTVAVTAAERQGGLVMGRGDMIFTRTGDRATRISPTATTPVPSPAPPRDRPRVGAPAPGAPGSLPRVGAPAPRAPAAAPAPADDRLTFALPYELAIGDGSATVRVLQPIVEFEEGGLSWNQAEKAYTGSILVGLLDRDRPGDNAVLWDTITIQITGDVMAVSPFRLARTNIPFQQVALRARRAGPGGVRIRLRPSFDPIGVDMTVPVLAPEVVVSASPRRIAGFGLEKTEVRLEVSGGAPEVPLALAASRSRPQPSRLPAGKELVASLRSRSTGVDTVRIATPPFIGSAIVEYAFPTGFLVAVLLGGLLGGALNAISRNRQSSLRAIGVMGVQGVLVGILAAVLYALGINVIGWAPDADAGEALMFAVAAISGMAGPRIFDRFMPDATRKHRDPPAPAAPSAPVPAAAAAAPAPARRGLGLGDLGRGP